MSSITTTLICPLILITTVGCSSPEPEVSATSDLSRKIERFAPTEITADISRLSEGDRKALEKLVEAARLMDKIFIRQVWSRNEALQQKLEGDKSTAGLERLHYFNINMSPWSTLDDNEPFIKDVPHPRPQGANYYPADMSKEEFDSWVETLPESEKQRATGFFYTIRRDAEGKLSLNPYSEEYKDLLEAAAQLLREAASLTDNQSLGTYLTKRADAFLSNDYYDSDVAWMEMDSPIDVTIGPYEVYMDELFNYKASFEAFITLRNDEETRKLAVFSSYLQDIEDNLPIDPHYRNPKLGALAPIRVVNEVVVGGEARAGVQTLAFNLPNDEQVTREKGSKRVMLRNVQEAKFRKILKPIGGIAVDPQQRSLIAFEPFFRHSLTHELMHGLGPHTITVNDKQTTVRKELKELGSAFEEAKADISGLWAMQYLMDNGVVEKSTEQQMYVTFLASAFRSVRFGINEAHGKGIALQFNYLIDEGALVRDESTGTFAVNFDKIKLASRKLTSEIMTIQAEGSYAKAKTLLDRYAVIRPAMQEVLDKLVTVPVDIEPQFPIAQPN
jgi:hypothetical protein